MFANTRWDLSDSPFLHGLVFIIVLYARVFLLIDHHFSFQVMWLPIVFSWVILLFTLKIKANNTNVNFFSFIPPKRPKTNPRHFQGGDCKNKKLKEQKACKNERVHRNTDRRENCTNLYSSKSGKQNKC